jgi:pyruvate/2-oxoglutarate dehydrogenase complex dihydrolipoamide dehydrogenase (E3) component
MVFRRFGSSVTVLESGPRLLGPEEPEAGALLEEVFASEGIEVRTGVTVGPVEHDGHRFRLEVGGSEPVTADRLLVATGRHAELSRLNVSSVGLSESDRFIPVDDHLRVDGVERTWAIGDMTGKGAFTHVAMYQADIVVNDILGRPVVAADYRALPRVTFTDPEIGSVGLSERDALERGLEVRIGTTEVPSSTRGWIHKAGNRGFIKLVEDATRGVLVGATSAGPWGGEVLGLLTLAVHAEVPTTQLRHMIYAYPTFHRAIESAVKELCP